MSEMTLAQAVSECGKWGNLMRALGKVSDVANHVASLAQQEAELKQGIEAMRAEYIAARDARDRATAEAVEIRTQAKADAEAVASNATSKAASLVQAAKDEVESLQRSATAAQQAADAFLSQRAAIKEEINAAGAELERIRADIEAAKAEARRRFGS